MTERADFSKLTPQQKEEVEKEGWTAWSKRHYNTQYENWMPWIEDQYLSWFGKDNKASYATKQQLDKSKITGIEQVDNLQDGVNNLVAGQVGKGGLAQPAGDYLSKEGINRAERGGKDDKGAWAPGPANTVAQPVAEGVQGAGSSVAAGAKGASGYVTGLWGGKKEEKK
ncbi:hypothetical protein BT63DRAFT_426053 [Microthyrium microscopicum]|uniref:Uncharacterized protein n=1 Tax=Microthyrium microscopicum TaxID=703497 RepID=A0A6A6UCF3_9PEZI|nr:hypothetical protein BT63DRAFT_426053 [Microthyrium microscopicum]